MKAIIRLKGGKGSGHFGHSGRPGKVGGSSSNVALYEEIIQAANDYEIYFRAHNKAGITLEQMQNWKSNHDQSYNVDTEEDEEVWLEGVAASDVLGETSFGGSSGVAKEIVIFRGNKLGEIYDGVIVYPTKIVARMTTDEYFGKFLKYVDEKH